MISSNSGRSSHGVWTATHAVAVEKLHLKKAGAGKCLDVLSTIAEFASGRSCIFSISCGPIPVILTDYKGNTQI